MKKLYVSFIIFMLVTLLSSMVFAAVTSKFEVVDDQVCTIKINDYCEFEKRMTSYDLEKRQVTIQLKIKNDAPLNVPNGEIMLVLDDSNSMNEESESGAKRGDLVYGAAKSLVTKIFENSDRVKVGIVKFSTKSVTEEGIPEDASLVSELTNNKDALINAIDSIEKVGIRTDLDAGLTLGSNYFTEEKTNKYLVVLTDGVPNVALNLANTEQGYGDSVINKTKATLQNVASKANLITMLTGISHPDANATGSDYTYSQIIEKVFGTPENPTAGKFYYISDSQIDSTVKNDIYNDLLAKPQTVTNIRINDFFPQQIVDNFEFAYISQPTKGTITETIDSENKIVWTIDSLASGEEATVQYTLTLKDNYDPSIVNVILDTNEKVTIDYKDFDGKDDSKTSDETPKVRITEQKNDPTVAPKIIPKAGSTTIISASVLLVIVALVSGVKTLKINNDIKKQ